MMRKNSTKFNEKEIVVSKTRTRPMRTRTRVVAASTTPYYAYDNHGRKARKKKKKKKSRRNSETTSSLSSLDFPLSSWCASTTSEFGSGFKECEQVENNNVEKLSKFVDCDKQASLFDTTEKLKPTQMNGLDCTSMKSTAEFKPTTIPSKHELEEFFSSAEKQLHDQFSNKYNFDVVKDVPLEGRYEWVQIKP